MNVLRNLCLAITIMFVATLPSSAVELATPVKDTTYMPVSLFSTNLTDPGCETNEPKKPHPIPGYRFSYQMTDMCEYYYPSYTAVAMSVFYIEWVVNFGDSNNEVKEALEELFVEYNSHQRRISRVYSVDGTFRPGPTVINGLTGERGKYIFVWSGDMPGRLWDTSLIHELVHVAIYAHNNGEHGDPDHEGDKYEGWTEKHTDFIKSTNRILEDLDI